MLQYAIIMVGVIKSGKTLSITATIPLRKSSLCPSVKKTTLYR